MGVGAGQARQRRATAALLLFLAVALHNLEEGAAYAATRTVATQLIGRALPGVELPTPGAFQAALLLLTLLMGGLLLWSARTARGSAGWLALRLTALVLLANVLLPHVPAAIALGGYAPGVVTAVAINLPLGLWVLSLDVRGQEE